MEITIKKRDSVVESYSFDKLVTSIAKAGVPIADSDRIAKSVEEWMKSTKAREISSSEIRDKIISLMVTEFPAEADTYKAYKKN